MCTPIYAINDVVYLYIPRHYMFKNIVEINNCINI